MQLIVGKARKGFVDSLRRQLAEANSRLLSCCKSMRFRLTEPAQQGIAGRAGLRDLKRRDQHFRRIGAREGFR